MSGEVKPDSESSIPGLVVAAGVLTGLAGVVLSVVALFIGMEIGAGLFMLASAVVFGALANAVFRR